MSLHTAFLNRAAIHLAEIRAASVECIDSDRRVSEIFSRVFSEEKGVKELRFLEPKESPIERFFQEDYLESSIRMLEKTFSRKEIRKIFEGTGIIKEELDEIVIRPIVNSRETKFAEYHTYFGKSLGLMPGSTEEDQMKIFIEYLLDIGFSPDQIETTLILAQDNYKGKKLSIPIEEEWWDLSQNRNEILRRLAKDVESLIEQARLELRIRDESRSSSEFFTKYAKLLPMIRSLSFPNMGSIPPHICFFKGLSKLVVRKVSRVSRQIIRLPIRNLQIHGHRNMGWISSLRFLETLDILEGDWDRVPDLRATQLQSFSFSAHNDFPRRRDLRLPERVTKIAITGVLFSEFPEGNFPALKELFLHGGEIRSLPREGEWSSPELCKLSVRGNRIEGFSRRLYRFDHVDNLDLSYQKGNGISFEDFRGVFPAVTRLDITCTRVEALSRSVVEPLQVLLIRGSCLSNFEERVWSRLNSFEMGGSELIFPEEAVDSVARICEARRSGVIQEALVELRSAGYLDEMRFLDLFTMATPENSGRIAAALLHYISR